MNIFTRSFLNPKSCMAMRGWFGKSVLVAGLTLCAACAFGAARPELNIQQLIDAAIAQKSETLQLPKGEFTVIGDAKVAKAENLTIRGEGTTLYFSPKSSYFGFSGCKNITLRDVVIDSDPLPFTQATVTKIDAVAGVMEYRVHDGYPRMEKGTTAGMGGVFVFDPKTRLWRPDIADVYPSRNEMLTPGTGRVHFRGALPGYKLIREGDLIAFKSHGPNAVRFSGCNGVKLENVAVRSAGLGAYILRACEGEIRLQGCRIERGPTPPGVTEPRLISTNADGLNLGYCRQGVRIENCDFAWMGDDGINLHGTIQTVVANEGGKVLWAASRNFPEFTSKMRAGDKVNVLQQGGYGLKGSATASRVEVRKEAPQAVEAAAREILKIPAEAKLQYARIELAEPVEAVAGDSFEVPAIACNGFVIRNNRFHDHRARGVRIGASEGVIENNRFERIKSSAVTLGLHAVHNEGGWVHNVIVRNNLLDDVCMEDRAFEPAAYNAGAITVQHFLYNGTPYPTGNTGIVIENNTIKNVGGPAIMAVSAKDLAIRNNVIENDHRREISGAGSKVNLVTDGDICINHSVETVVEGNGVVGSGGKKPARVITNP